MKFYLSRQGQQLGPWSEQEILVNLKADHVSWTDYVYDEQNKEWVMLMEFVGLSHEFKSLLESSNHPRHSIQPDPVQSDMKKEKEWYVLKAENKYGPFTFLEIVRMLQEKSLYEYDFVWNPKLDPSQTSYQNSQWRQIADMTEFAPHKIKALQKSKDEDVKDVFFRRRFARKSYGASLLVHNSKAVWKGESIEISSGGAGIIVENTEFEMGQTLFLHFKVGDGVPPFNAICSVVSKHFESEKKIKYGVKFTSISQSVQQAIKSYTDKAA